MHDKYKSAPAVCGEEHITEEELASDNCPYLEPIKAGYWYLACPYTVNDSADWDMLEHRFEQVTRVAAILFSKNVYVFSPITHSHPMAEYGFLPTGYEYWKEYDRMMIESDRCLGVLVFNTPGWSDSDGVRDEVSVAACAGKPVRMVNRNGDISSFFPVSTAGHGSVH